MTIAWLWAFESCLVALSGASIFGRRTQRSGLRVVGRNEAQLPSLEGRHVRLAVEQSRFHVALTRAGHLRHAASSMRGTLQDCCTRPSPVAAVARCTTLRHHSYKDLLRRRCILPRAAYMRPSLTL